MSREALPENFGRYQFLSVLGAGAFATIYKVTDTQIGRSAAMKILMPDLDMMAQDRFTREAKVLGRLNHPNIPGIYDYGELADGRRFLVTEFVDGSSLGQLITSQVEFSTQDVLLLAMAVAHALGYAHEKGILHQDVKPDNILVPRNAQGGMMFRAAKLIDFGVLGVLEGDTGSTRAGTVFGTPYYMSPEQVRGEGLTPAADIFALAVVMYQLLSGSRPFDENSAQEMFFAILSKDPRPLGPPVPPEVADLVRRCLAKHPSERPQSGAELAASLGRLLRTVAASAPLSTVRAVPIAVTPETVSSPIGASLRSHAVAIVSALLAIAGCAVLVPASKKLPGEWWSIVFGALLVAAGVAMGAAVRHYLARRRSQLTDDFSAVLKGAKTKKALSMTLAVQVESVVKKCQMMDERFLGLTMALMVKEYDSARKFDDKQKALMNAVAILDKLRPTLSPWYVRYEKLIAVAVSLVGVVAGLVTMVQNVEKLMQGKP